LAQQPVNGSPVGVIVNVSATDHGQQPQQPQAVGFTTSYSRVSGWYPGAEKRNVYLPSGTRDGCDELQVHWQGTPSLPRQLKSMPGDSTTRSPMIALATAEVITNPKALPGH
jgi:hypothetical protein